MISSTLYDNGVMDLVTVKPRDANHSAIFIGNTAGSIDHALKISNKAKLRFGNRNRRSAKELGFPCPHQALKFDADDWGYLAFVRYSQTLGLLVQLDDHKQPYDIISVVWRTGRQFSINSCLLVREDGRGDCGRSHRTVIVKLPDDLKEVSFADCRDQLVPLVHHFSDCAAAKCWACRPASHPELHREVVKHEEQYDNLPPSPFSPVRSPIGTPARSARRTEPVGWEAKVGLLVLIAASYGAYRFWEDTKKFVLTMVGRSP